MSLRQEYTNVGGLRAFLTSNKSRIKSIMNEVMGLGVPGLMKPDVFRKFLELLADVATEQEEENRLISQIEEVESLHRLNRSNHYLEQASLAYEPKPAANGNETEEQERRRFELWRIFDAFLKPSGNNNDN